MYKYLKRFFDIIFSLIALIIITPILLPVMIALRLSGDGEVFFLQDRIGYKNQIFKCWKFATMVKGAEKIGNAEVTTVGDPRITPLGGFLRKTKINELPQLVNILKGDMSFVGPRPVLKEANFDHYPEEAKAVIYDVTPGLTGIGSIIFRDEEEILTRVKDEGRDPRQFNYDEIYPYKGKVEVWYLGNQSFWVDFKILFLTAWTVIFSSSQLVFDFFKGLPIQTETLAFEFNKVQKIKVGISFGILALVILLPLVPLPIRWDTIQWTVFGALPVISLAYLLFFKASETRIQLIRSDLGWFVFLIFGFVSLFIANDFKLALFYFCAWFSFYMWMLLFRAPVMQQVIDTHLPKIFYYLAIVLVMHSLLFIILMIIPYDITVDLKSPVYNTLSNYLDFPRKAIVLNDAYAWGKVFGSNANYTVTFILSLFPFILFSRSKSQLQLLIKILSTCIVGFIIYTSGARGVMIALLFVGLYYFLCKGFTKVTIVYSLVSICLLFNFMSEYFTGSSLLSGADTSYQVMNAQSKVFLIYSSFQLFFERPLFGIGLGNWINEVYCGDLSSIPPFNNSLDFIRVNSHNVFVQLLTEVGIIGFLGFLIPFLSVLHKGFTGLRSMTRFQKAAFSSILVYLITSNFYGASNFDSYNFSRIQLVAFCCLGIVSYDRTSPSKAMRWFNVSLLFLSSACFSIFVITSFYKLKHRSLLNPRANQFMSEKILDEYDRDYKYIVSDRTWIERKAANSSVATGRFDMAENYFIRALQKSPYDGHVLLHYAQFLKSIRNDTKKAEELALIIHRIQNTNVEVNLLLGDIALETGELEKAKKYLGHLLLIDNLKNDDQVIQRIKSLELRIKEADAL